MRKIERIVIHCSGGPSTQSAARIIDYHTRPVAQGGRGWKNPGYHYIIEQNGRIVTALPENRIANGARGYNATSIHICYCGGVDGKGKPKDTRTTEQTASLLRLVSELRERYGKIPVTGHRDLSPDRNHDGRITPDEWIKACPCFEVSSLFTSAP